MNKVPGLYHTVPYLSQTQTRLLHVNLDESNSPYCVLSQTIFYPQGGGQLGDRGYLVLPNMLTSQQKMGVITTKRKDEEIRHYLDINEIGFDLLEKQAGQQVTAILDWDLRYHQMRIHSAVHLIHCILEQVTGHSIPYPVRSPLNDESGENHYQLLDYIDEDILEKATTELNEFCSSGHAIQTVNVPEQGNNFRIWKCGRWSIPCGGTHVKDTKEIGMIFSTLKIKKNMTRIALRLSDNSG
ncbi:MULTISPECIES: alanyl-tRNA editing protein [Klebsiella]|uniref:alanyl-tRNA editing protein n=1 Tax=Klebsiella TaxID=570 RepID=UPI001D0D692E|nr:MULTISPECIES: alanyl-tRNA editing protein [Klebsiella]